MSLLARHAVRHFRQDRSITELVMTSIVVIVILPNNNFFSGMNLEEIKQHLRYEIKPDETWLHNCYPARPEHRCDVSTLDNYQNIEDVFGLEAKKKIERAVKKNPLVAVVILAELPKSGKMPKKVTPLVFLNNEAHYYKRFELFSASLQPTCHGFIEVFHHNIA
jgi:hypothetical protein